MLPGQDEFVTPNKKKDEDIDEDDAEEFTPAKIRRRNKRKPDTQTLRMYF